MKSQADMLGGHRPPIPLGPLAHFFARLGHRVKFVKALLPPETHSMMDLNTPDYPPGRA
jgi:hypothetical protein